MRPKQFRRLLIDCTTQVAGEAVAFLVRRLFDHAGPFPVVIAKAGKNSAAGDASEFGMQLMYYDVTNIGDGDIKRARANRVDAADEKRRDLCGIRLQIANDHRSCTEHLCRYGENSRS